MSMNNAVGVFGAVPVPEAIKAYEEQKAEFAQVPTEKMVFRNVEVTGFVARLLAQAGPIASQVPDANARVVGFEAQLFLNVRRRALGLMQAHSLHTYASTPVVDELPAHVEKATSLRTKMLDTTQYLVRQGKLDGSVLEPIKNTTAHRVIASDLMGMSNLYRAQWDRLNVHGTVDKDDQDEASTLAVSILDAVAAREENERQKSETDEMLQKAYSLVFNEYDEIRRIVSFLRWHEGDAEEIAPSLFTGRRSGKKGDKQAGDEATSDAQGAPSGGGQVVGVSGESKGAPAGQPVVGTSGAQQLRVTVEPAVPVGHEGGSPFIS